MNHLPIEELAERLAAAERSLALVHAELSGLRKSARHGTATRAATVLLTISAAFASAMFWRGGITYAGSTSKVTAPFVVTNSVGNRILFTIQETDEGTQATLWNNEAHPVTAVMATSAGGAFLAAGPDAKPRASIGVVEGDGAMALWDRENKLIADIARGETGRGLGIYDDDGNPKIDVATTKDSALINLKTEYAGSATGLYADNNNSFVVASDPVMGNEIAVLGHQYASEPEKGKLRPPRLGLTVFGEQGDPVAAVYRNQAGNGTVAAWKAGDKGQNDGVMFGVGDEGPIVNLNKNGKCVARLTQLESGNGILQVCDKNGMVSVAAGTASDGAGRVDAFPERTPAYMLNLPGSFIVGGKQGSSGGGNE